MSNRLFESFDDTSVIEMEKKYLSLSDDEKKIWHKKYSKKLELSRKKLEKSTKKLKDDGFFEKNKMD